MPDRIMLLILALFILAFILATIERPIIAFLVYSAGLVLGVVQIRQRLPDRRRITTLAAGLLIALALGGAVVAVLER